MTSTSQTTLSILEEDSRTRPELLPNYPTVSALTETPASWAGWSSAGHYLSGDPNTRKAVTIKDVATVAEFWRVVRDAINSNGMTARLCVLLLFIALLGFAWHR